MIEAHVNYIRHTVSFHYERSRVMFFLEGSSYFENQCGTVQNFLTLLQVVTIVSTVF